MAWYDFIYEKPKYSRRRYQSKRSAPIYRRKPWSAENWDMYRTAIRNGMSRAEASRSVNSYKGETRR